MVNSRIAGRVLVVCLSYALVSACGRKGELGESKNAEENVSDEAFQQVIPSSVVASAAAVIAERQVTSNLDAFTDILKLYSIFQSTNWWETDLSTLSNLLQGASFGTCNKLCNITGGKEDFYGQRLVAVCGLEKAGSQHQTNNMLLRIAKSSLFMGDETCATQALNQMFDDGNPVSANYFYQRELWWKRFYARYGDVDAAMKHSEAILEKYPDVVPFAKPMEYMSLAIMHLYKDDPSGADEWLKAYLQLDRSKYAVGDTEEATRMREAIAEGTWREKWTKPVTEQEWIARDRNRGISWETILADIKKETPAPANPTLQEQLRNKIMDASNFYHCIQR